MIFIGLFTKMVKDIVVVTILVRYMIKIELSVYFTNNSINRRAMVPGSVTCVLFHDPWVCTILTM